MLFFLMWFQVLMGINHCESENIISQNLIIFLNLCLKMSGLMRKESDQAVHKEIQKEGHSSGETQGSHKGNKRI